jgi:hypothetical protein
MTIGAADGRSGGARVLATPERGECSAASMQANPADRLDGSRDLHDGGMASDAADSGPPAKATAEIGGLLAAEYGVLTTALNATWAIAMTRVSLLLGVLSAGLVGLTIVAQAVGFGNTFFEFALVVLPLPLFLGLATFARLVQVNREVIVYIVGMNRIRRAMATLSPAILPALVLPIHDDIESIHRSPGGGMTRRAPRYRLVYAIVQVPGLVAVVDASIAAALALVLTARLGLPTGAIAIVTVLTFVAVGGGLIAGWRRSMSELETSLRPEFPTPFDAIDRPVTDAGRL